MVTEPQDTRAVIKTHCLTIEAPEDNGVNIVSNNTRRNVKANNNFNEYSLKLRDPTVVPALIFVRVRLPVILFGGT